MSYYEDSFQADIPNVSFIGMPGVGKSVLGREVSEYMKWAFFDTDKIMELTLNKPLARIVEVLGEKRFLQWEDKVIRSLPLTTLRAVISPGGSAVYSPRAMKFLRAHTIVVYLSASARDVKDWIRDDRSRGIVGTGNGGIEALYRERVPLYRKYADVTVKVNSGHDIDELVPHIVKKAAEFSVSAKKKKR
ncbi:MAG: hypothetical protein GF333_01015 [Candidatus Omnitrophica bacterium]|nr:hypothetical protein [Candidatus Omnitrophota bacterium]